MRDRFRFEPPLRNDLAAFGEPCTRELERAVDHYFSMREWFDRFYARGAHRRGRRFEVARDNLAVGVYGTLLRHGVKLTTAAPVGVGKRRPRGVAPAILKRILQAVEPGWNVDLKRTMRSAKGWAELARRIETEIGPSATLH